MGGTVFGVQANRLSLEQHAALAAYCRDKLATFFSGIHEWRNLGNKASHGDLDLLCVLDTRSVFGSRIVGQDGGINTAEELQAASETLSRLSARADMPIEEIIDSLTIPDDVDHFGIRRWAVAISKALRARAWLRDGWDGEPELMVVIDPSEVLRHCAAQNHAALEIGRTQGCPEGVNGSQRDGHRDISTTPLPSDKMKHAEILKLQEGLHVDLCRAVEGVEWKARHANGVSIGIACCALPSVWHVDPTEEQPFWQVDLCFIPAKLVPFNLLIGSYGSTLCILSAALGILSPCLKLDKMRLAFKHSPFSGFPPIGLRLTTDPKAFCKWVGLDHAAWQEEVFANEDRLYRWLSNVGSDSLLGSVWRRVAQRPDLSASKDVAQKHKRKLSDLDDFFQWLRRPDSEWTIKVEDGRSTSRSGLRQSHQPVPQLFADPDHPVPLDAQGQATLEYWGAQGDYNKFLAERQAEVRMKAEARKVKEDQKAGLERYGAVLKAEGGEVEKKGDVAV